MKLKLKTLLASTTIALSATAANAETLRVPNDVGDGHLNIRSGPGVNYALVGAAPAGATFNWDGPAYCVPRQDGIRGADWCRVNYNGRVGWASRAGLMPVVDTSNGEPPYRGGPISPDYLGGGDAPELLHCGAAQVTPAEYDTNPVISTEIAYNPDTHVWTVDHHMRNGQIAARQQQYAMTDWPFDAYTNDVRWTGNLLRDPKIHMVGWIRYTNQGIFYEEQVYNRSHGDRLETRIVARCQSVQAQKPSSLPVPQGTVIERSPPPVVMQQQPAPAPQPAPAGPVTAPVIVQAPAPQPPVVVVVPGTTYSPTPKQEKEGS
jgi:hypothetical protein